MKKYEVVMNEMFGRMNIEVGIRKSEKEELDDYELNDFVLIESVLSIMDLEATAPAIVTGKQIGRASCRERV